MVSTVAHVVVGCWLLVLGDSYCGGLMVFSALNVEPVSRVCSSLSLSG